MKKPQAQLPVFLKLDKVCNRYDVGKTWIYEAIKDDRFPAPKKFGNNSRWSLTDLLKWEIDTGLSEGRANPEPLADTPIHDGVARC